MVKVEQNIIPEESSYLKASVCKYIWLISLFKKPAKNELLNFMVDDFLGINRRFKLAVVNNSCPNNPDLTTYSYLLSSLKRIFNANTLIFPDETIVHQIVLQKLVAPCDFIVLDEFANSNLKIAVKYLNNLGIPSETIQNNNPEKLEKIIIARKNHRGKIWFAGQSIYPVPGKYAQLHRLKALLEKHQQLYLFLDDAYSVGWYGSSGQGIVCSNFQNMEKVAMVAALTKGFGANGGAIVVSGINSKCLGEENPLQNLQLHNLNSIIQAAILHNTKEITLLQMQLRRRINYFHKLIKGHLPCLSDPSLPMCFIATGLPEISHEICSWLIKEGYYINSAVFPHSSIQQPGIKINITLENSDNDIKALVSVLKNAYQKILRRNNKTIEQLLIQQQP